MTKFEIFYKDSAYYGTMIINSLDQEVIEAEIQSEIDANNTNPNADYHISRSNFKEEPEHKGFSIVYNPAYGFYQLSPVHPECGASDSFASIADAIDFIDRAE